MRIVFSLSSDRVVIARACRRSSHSCQVAVGMAWVEAFGVQGELHQGDLLPVRALRVHMTSPDVPISFVNVVGP